MLTSVYLACKSAQGTPRPMDCNCRDNCICSSVAEEALKITLLCCSENQINSSPQAIENGPGKPHNLKIQRTKKSHRCLALFPCLLNFECERLV